MLLLLLLLLQVFLSCSSSLETASSWIKLFALKTSSVSGYGVALIWRVTRADFSRPGMENLTYDKDGFQDGVHRPSLSYSSSQRDVSYSCGSCGYALNLSSSNRNISTIGSKYGKSIKRGIISFFYIDDSRFTQVDEIQCVPHFSKNSWGLFRRRIKLLCRKCNNRIGISYDDYTTSYPVASEDTDSSSGHEVSKQRKYDIRIRALQPLSSEESAL
ncbi:hypothetical protein PanWU01x14_247560 [Parasponia andersonii]|uniref:Uncharacterized protein n=1 Tax=Parasponia andersonii TaxID=3476 RepID=A0A2P5BDY4_PARAD|nr:hypothetical protein PanWU01x14_247560 [Parasponia andersonii]